MPSDGLLTIFREDITKLQQESEQLARAIDRNDCDAMSTLLLAIKRSLNRATTACSVLELELGIDNKESVRARRTLDEHLVRIQHYTSMAEAVIARRQAIKARAHRQ